MSNNNIGLKRKQATQVTEEAKEFVKSTTWINVGIETKEGFISLPMNIPLDNMREAKGSSELSQKKNKLLAKIKELVAQLEPGESKTVNLTVQIYRVPEEAEEIEDKEFDEILDGIA